MIGATYTTLSDPFYETINDEIQMQIKSNGDLLLVRDPGQDQERQNQPRQCPPKQLHLHPLLPANEWFYYSPVSIREQGQVFRYTVSPSS